MTADELIISYSVRVNSGSGVLVSALSLDYTYVLTAKHVIDGPIVISRDGNVLNVIGAPYHHPDYDCSVIKVEFQSDVAQHIWRGELDVGSRISYVGYPRSNISSARPYKIYAGTSNDKAHQFIVCNLDNGPGQESIEGMSGGGVYHNQGGLHYLWGVEARMDDEDSELRFGRIRCHPIECFDQIIEVNQLALMAPFYMNCFSNFRSDIFHFNAANPRNVERLRGKLGEAAEWLIDQNMPAPHDLMVRYKRELLLGDSEPVSTALDRKLWVAYLEFAVVSTILDGVDIIDEAYLNSLDRRRRFMYSCSDDNWIWKLSDLMKAAREMLDVNGTILVSSPEENAVVWPDPEDITEVLDDITSSPKFRAMARIDSARGDIIKTYTFAHLKGLRNTCVLAKHRDYLVASPAQQLSTLREYYDHAIKNGA